MTKLNMSHSQKVITTVKVEMVNLVRLDPFAIFLYHNTFYAHMRSLPR